MQHHRRHRNREEKIAERENRNNIQQMYMSSPVKSCEKISENDMAGN